MCTTRFSPVISVARNLGHKPPDRRLFPLGEVEEADNVPPGDDQRMALREGAPVGEGEGELPLHLKMRPSSGRQNGQGSSVIVRSTDLAPEPMAAPGVVQPSAPHSNRGVHGTQGV